MKVIVAGSRSIKELDIVRGAIQNAPFEVNEIIHGGAKGVDSNAGLWASLNTVDETIVEPDYEEHDERAPLARNKQMAIIGDALIAVWDGESTGTQHMMTMAEEAGMQKVEEKETKDGIIIRYYK